MTAGPNGRSARESGQGLIAAAISVVVRAAGVLAVFQGHLLNFRMKVPRSCPTQYLLDDTALAALMS